VTSKRNQSNIDRLISIQCVAAVAGNCTSCTNTPEKRTVAPETPLGMKAVEVVAYLPVSD